MHPDEQYEPFTEPAESGRKTTFHLTLFDDESTREKLKVMSPLDVMWDDERNQIPDEYYDIVDVKPGGMLSITVQEQLGVPDADN